MTTEYQVIFMPSGRRGQIEEGTAVLEAARQLGVQIESVCGGNLACRKCHVRLETGQFAKHGIHSKVDHLSPIGEAERAALERMRIEDGRLSCTAQIQGDVLIVVPEESQGQKQTIRKEAVEREITLDPAIRQLVVNVQTAELGEHRGEWGRVQDALREEWGIETAVIDLPALRRLQPALRDGKRRITLTLRQNHEVIDVQAGRVETAYGLAVDIGSTTVAGHLCDLRTGDILATESLMNPQVAYGEDLMSRISYTTLNKGGLSRLHKGIIAALNKIILRTAKRAGIQAGQIQEAVFVGNTTMTHILLNIHPEALGGAPFALANRDGMDVKARDLGLRMGAGAAVHILPSEAGHVGADNVGVLIAEEPYNQDEVTLIVDVGTNAEIVLGNRKWLYSASSPTGPAFEGAQIEHGMRAAPGAIERVRIDPITKAAAFEVIGGGKAAGICGSGIIEVVAELYLAGVLMANGRFDPAYTGERMVWDGRKGAYILALSDQTTTGEPLLITQDDVRNIQLAKAALYAGAKVLMMRAGVTAVDKIVLAGAFGSYIDPNYAMVLGLIPDCDLEKVTAVGNAAGDGARIALLNRQKRIEAQKLVQRVNYVETAVDPDFQEEFVKAIHLPHAEDPFPHIAALLPTKKAAPTRQRRRRRRK